MGEAQLLVSVAGDPAAAARRVVAARQGETRWLDRFSDALDRHRSAGELDRVLRVWDLSKADAARLFGVSRQAVGKWAADGVPADRVAAVMDLAAATDLLVRYLRRDRIPAVVRRPFRAADGVSLLELAGTDPAAVLGHVRAMFDFARVQA